MGSGSDEDKRDSAVKARGVDDRNNSQPPLDFSFRDIQSINELVKIGDDVVQPRWFVLAQPAECKIVQKQWNARMFALREHLKREEQLRLEGQKPIPRMDVWAHIEKGDVDAILGSGGIDAGPGGPGGGEAGPQDNSGSASSLFGAKKEVDLPKLGAKCLRVNNNRMETVEGFGHVMNLLFLEPAKLCWLDLSFNRLTIIDDELIQFVQLKSLYLHGNTIADISEVEKLIPLSKLITLTLHGNGLHGLDDYQSFVITTLPWIKRLDFVCLTPDMKKMASRWEKVFGKGKIKSQGKALHQFEAKMRALERND